MIEEDLDLNALLDDLAEDVPEPPKKKTKKKKAAKKKSLPVENSTPRPYGDVHPYSADPYIRELGAVSVSCFGYWTTTDAACGLCPLRVECHTQRKILRAELGAHLLREENPNYRPETENVQVKAMAQEFEDEEEPPPPPGSKYKPPPGAYIRDFKPDVPTMCGHCKTQMPRGYDTKWVKGEGLFHLDCIDLSDFE